MHSILQVVYAGGHIALLIDHDTLTFEAISTALLINMHAPSTSTHNPQ